ncbi:TetR/AcrR family transcriptional regulator [Pseudomonadota bacterium]|nr:TetR/AcrR family transcriptional regulator [Pseudomonadota bacterium]
MGSVRVLVKQERRDRILSCAQELISREGFEGLSIRVLAAKAGVSTPTIYNLVGNKEAILHCLGETIVQQLTEAYQSSVNEDPINQVKEIIQKLHHIYAQDEHYSRELFIGKSTLSQAGYGGASENIPMLKVATAICENALKKRLLRGEVSSAVLGQGIGNSVYLAQLGWIQGSFGLNEFKRQAMIGIYLTLAADSMPKLQARLVKYLKRMRA